MKKYLSLCLALSLALSLAACGGSTVAESNTGNDTSVPVTAESVQSAEPAEAPVEEPEEDPEEFVIPDNVVYTGSGDDVLTIEPFDGPYVFFIEGNSEDRYFSVKSYDDAGNYLDLLVNTTEPYEGLLIDMTQSTSMMEVNATGDWTITLTSLYNLPMASSGITCNGSGDSVFLFSGDVKTATITGNQEGRYFSVKAYGDYDYDLLVNTTDPYEGKVLIKCDPFIFIVKAVGDWSITFD